MITSVLWMPKEAADAMADATRPEEYNEESKDEMQNSHEELDQVANAKAVANSFGSKSSNIASSSKDSDEVAKFLKELNMENYDKEDDDLQLSSSDLYYPSNDLDPYLNNNIVDKYDLEERDDITIRPTDSLIISTSIEEGPISYLKVYIYETPSEGPPHIYLRDELIIPEAPFWTAWLDCPLKGGDTKGNFVAIGSLKPSIDIWDLDLIAEDEELPCVELGKSSTSDSHTDSVLGLSWNTEFRNLVASASVDEKVKVWDVATGQCMLTLDHHKDKVQAVEWNRLAPQVLLSGSCDRTAVVRDGRNPSISVLKYSIKADVENLAWDPHCEHSFVASLEDGTVNGYNMRASGVCFTLRAHDDEVCSISYNRSAPNLLVTGSKDKCVKLWDLSNNQPSWIATHNPDVGIVFSVAFSEASPFLLAIGGSEGELKVWDTLSNSAMSRKYGSN